MSLTKRRGDGGVKKGIIHAISISPERGQLKKEVLKARVIKNHGIEKDAHAGDWGRQVTCLDWRSVKEANERHSLDAGPGDFAENILIDGLDLTLLIPGSKLRLGTEVVLEVTQIGKEEDPNYPSVVQRTLGVSLLPKEGLFCKVIEGGHIGKGDEVLQL